MASSLSRAEPEKRLCSAVERMDSSCSVVSECCRVTAPVAMATSEPCAPWLLEEAMMRSSCSSVASTRFHEAPSSPPRQWAILKSDLSACTFLAESVVKGSGS